MNRDQSVQTRFAQSKYVFVLILGSLVWTRDASAYCRSTIEGPVEGRCATGLPAYWPVTSGSVARVGVAVSTVNLVADQDFTQLLSRSLPFALSSWTELPCAPSIQTEWLGFVSTTTGYHLSGPNVNTVMVNPLWRPDLLHRPGTVAITILTMDTTTGALLDADIELNAWSAENTRGYHFSDGESMWGVPDAPSVLLHEVGHLLGFDHSLDEQSVLWPTMDVERQRRNLSNDDIAAICETYSNSRQLHSASCVIQRSPHIKGFIFVVLCSVLYGIARNKQEKIR